MAGKPLEFQLELEPEREFLIWKDYLRFPTLFEVIFIDVNFCQGRKLKLVLQKVTKALGHYFPTKGLRLSEGRCDYRFLSDTKRDTLCRWRWHVKCLHTLPEGPVLVTIGFDTNSGQWIVKSVVGINQINVNLLARGLDLKGWHLPGHWYKQLHSLL